MAKETIEVGVAKVASEDCLAGIFHSCQVWQEELIEPFRAAVQSAIERAQPISVELFFRGLDG
jgi:hypothetical protein